MQMEDACEKRTPEVPAADPIVQYIVVRKDLTTALSWPLGSVVAQGCHASVAALWAWRTDPFVQEYTSRLDHMHKVVLAAVDEPHLHAVSADLKAAGIDHKVWVEQPENIATALATKPYPKRHFSSVLRKLRLLR